MSYIILNKSLKDCVDSYLNKEITINKLLGLITNNDYLLKELKSSIPFETNSVSETLYCYVNHISSHPVCPKCGINNCYVNNM